jgi:DNA-binding SARP family transcriptional activator/tetratricopeptide (TPR) repeat protein
MEVRAAGQVLDLGPPKRRLLFAALLVDAGRPVSVATLVDRVWDEAPPAEVRGTLYAHISHIRRLLAQVAGDGDPPVRLTRRDSGYLLEVDPDHVDLHLFRRLVEEARGERDQERARLLRTALELWRGVPFAGLSGAWVGRLRESWHQHRLDAVVAWSQTELELGNPGAVIGRIRDLTVEYPLAEPLTEVLMRALYATGQTAEALRCYATIRQCLADELGADPGAQLRELHQGILRDDLATFPVSVTPPSAPTSPAPAVPRSGPVAGAPPAQLPIGVAGFTGRARELAELDGLLVKAAGEPAAWAIVALSGTAGVGKTTLAVHWAHRVAGQFPDGQVYVNLRGFDPTGQAMAPTEAVRGFLDAFDVPPPRIPIDLGAQEALYRSLLAGRRVLVVLDNARDAEQVRPLLPGTPGCLVLVTSRSQLPGLVAAEGAHPLTLDLPSFDEAHQLLARRLGQSRVAAEPVAVGEIITRSARLPLALAIVAARAATHPGFPLSTLASELGPARDSLDAFAGADAVTDVRTVFSWSYRTLPPEAARLFRLLGLHPGPDLTAPQAASMAGVPVGQVRPLLAELAGAHLVTEHAPGRYALHDLLRAYAAELAGTTDSEPDRHAARHRLLDHHLHSGYRAALLMNPHRDAITLTAPVPGVTSEPHADDSTALAWFTAEHAVLLAVTRQAVDHGFDDHARQLAWILADFFQWQGHWHDWAAVQRVALTATRRSGDRAGQATAHRSLGLAYIRLGGQNDRAHAELVQALDLYRELGDVTGQAHSHVALGGLLEQKTRYRDALHEVEQALGLFRTVGHQIGQARALNAIGWCHTLLGDHQEALACCEAALALSQEVGERRAVANAWDSLGYAHHQLGEYQRAITCYQQAIDLFRRSGDQYYEADVLGHLGDTHAALGDGGAAHRAWRDALTILDDLGHAQADQVREKLDSLDRPGAG